MKLPMYTKHSELTLPTLHINDHRLSVLINDELGNAYPDIGSFANEWNRLYNASESDGSWCSERRKEIIIVPDIKRVKINNIALKWF